MLMSAQDRIDAAVRGGDRDQALAWVEDLDAFAAGTGLPWAQAAAAFGRARHVRARRRLTGAGSASCSRPRWPTMPPRNRPYDRARVQLAYGEFLRRNQRRVDARVHLRAALETFEDLHADPLAERARQELRASGETARKRDPSTLLDLTPMELKVAGAGQPPACRTRTSPPSAGSHRARSRSTCATCSPRSASPPAASSPSSTWAERAGAERAGALDKGRTAIGKPVARAWVHHQLPDP